MDGVHFVNRVGPFEKLAPGGHFGVDSLIVASDSFEPVCELARRDVFGYVAVNGLESSLLVTD